MPPIDLTRAIYEASGNPLDYPSAMSAAPILVVDDRWEALRMGDSGRLAVSDGTDVDRILERLGAAPVAGRIAQVAFGAHRNVSNIAWKFARHARQTGRPAGPFVMVPAWLDHADVVASNVSSGGHVYSGLFATRPGLPIRQYLVGARCPVMLLLLDDEQTGAMHDMAGIPRPDAAPGGLRCDLAVVSASLDDGRRCDALTYAVALPFLSLSGQPVAFSTVATTGRRWPAMTQEDMFRAINRLLGTEEEVQGVIPIADAFNQRRRALMAMGPEAAQRIPQDPLFVAVRDALAARHMLADEDGRVRRGLEDVWTPLSIEDAWRSLPTFQPRS